MRTLVAHGLAIFAAISNTAMGQNAISSQVPSILLNLPPEVQSEAVRINYFMIGPFGEYGSFIKTEKGRTVYKITVSWDGKPATTVKVIAYLPGCGIDRIEVLVQATIETRTLACEPPGWTLLHGRIFPISIIQGQTTEVEVDYLALWDHEFFGIIDGPVTSIHVATAIPDENGHFDVELPDYYNQADLERGEFQFILRQPISGNILAFLRPAKEYRGSVDLKVLPSYMPFVMFTGDDADSTTQQKNQSTAEPDSVPWSLKSRLWRTLSRFHWESGEAVGEHN